MLQAIRGRTASWIVRILFALLILSFAVWGIGDIFRGPSPDDVVAEIGDVEITARTVDELVRGRVDQLRLQFGPEFDLRTAVQLGLADGVVQNLVDRALIVQAAIDAGVTPSTALVAGEISQDPAFRSAETGRFDRQLFEQVLFANRLTEAGYVAERQRDVAGEVIQRAVTAPVAVPDALVEAMWRHRDEARVGRYLTVRADTAAVPEPDSATVDAFYEENIADYQAPEYRAFRIVRLTPELVAGEIVIPEDVLRAEYEDHRSFYVIPERRTFRQVRLPDEAAAADLAMAARTAAGGLEAAVAAADLDVRVSTLGPVTLDEVPVAGLGEAGFALDDGAIGDPVETSFGWVVLEVVAVEPGGDQPFDAVRDEIEAELKLEQAVDGLFELANVYRDAAAGGASLAEAAERLGTEAIAVASTDATGTPRDDTVAPPDIPEWPEALQSAFRLATPGETSDLIETDEGGYFVVGLDEIVERAPRPLDTVRDQVVADWRRVEARTAAEAEAQALAERVRAGQSLDALGEDREAAADASTADADPAAGEDDALGTLLEDLGAPPETTAGVVETAPILRTGDGAVRLTGTAVATLFDLATGDVSVVAAGDDWLVLTLGEVIAADARLDDAEAAARRDAVRAELRGGLAETLFSQFLAALAVETDVSIDRERIDQLYVLEP